MNTTTAKRYYAGVTTGEVVCYECAGHILQLKITYRPDEQFYAGAQDTYELLRESEVAELAEFYPSVCYCEAK